MDPEEILRLSPPPADARLSYGTDPHQFGDLRLPKAKGPHPVVMNIHGGFWRNKYDLTHAGHLCATLTAKGLATWNLEYRRVGDPGGGWPGTFSDVRDGYRFLTLVAKEHTLATDKIVVMGHSAGGQLALALAGHDASIRRVVSLAGVLDLQRAWSLHLSKDAVVEFLGGTPQEVPEHYREADPMMLNMPKAIQWVVHGVLDDVIPVDFSRAFSDRKKKQGEDVRLLEIEQAGHFDLIDPRSEAWGKIASQIVNLF